MLAVVMREFGPPEVLQPTEADEVRAGPGEVVIEAEFANVTFVETQIRAGRAPHPSMLPALPVILGNGTGGTVAGQRVVASLNGAGGYAERVAVDARRLIEVPDEVTLPDSVRAAVGQEFGPAEASAAHAAIEARATLGKTLLTVPR